MSDGEEIKKSYTGTAKNERKESYTPTAKNSENSKSGNKK